MRSSQNNICDNLLSGSNLLVQTKLVDHVSRFENILLFLLNFSNYFIIIIIFKYLHDYSVHPNIYIGKVDGSAMYRKWYFEATVDHIEQATHLEPHLRIGWANTMGYVPYPGGGEKWGGNGIGDDLYSFGFDGSNLISGSYI